MFTIKIRDKSLKVPNQLSEISLFTAVEVLSILNYEKEPDLNTQIAIISAISKIDVEIFINIEESSIKEVYEQIKPMFYSDLSLILYKNLLIDNTLFGLKDIEKLTVKEFIDLDYNLKEKDNIFENIDKIIAILLRKVTRKNNNSKNILNNIILKLFYKSVIPQVYLNYEIEDYNEDTLNNAELFLSKLDAQVGLSIFYYFIEYRNRIIKEYKGLFESDIIPEEDADQYDEEPILKKPVTYEDRWGWYHLLNTISNNIIEREVWLVKPIKEFLTQLLYNKERNMSEYERSKKQVNTYGR